MTEHNTYQNIIMNIIAKVLAIIFIAASIPCVSAGISSVHASGTIRSVVFSVSKIKPPAIGWSKEFTSTGSFAFAKDADVYSTSSIHAIGYTDYQNKPEKWTAAVYNTSALIRPSLKGDTAVNIGGTYTVNTSFSTSTVYDQMSGIIYNSANEVLAYGRIGGASSGEHSFTMPSSIGKGTYTLWVFLEKFNLSNADQIYSIGRVSFTVKENGITEQRGVTIDFSSPIIKGNGSGDLVQPNAGSGMTPVIVTLKDTVNYYFPKDYMADKSPKYGITIEYQAPARVIIYGVPEMRSTYINLDPPTKKTANPHSVHINNADDAETKGNMSRNISGGDTTQENVTDAMKAITYTAKDGYYFAEEDYPGTYKNGIYITRINADTIRISGTPTADVEFTMLEDIPAAREKSTPNDPIYVPDKPLPELPFDDNTGNDSYSDTSGSSTDGGLGDNSTRSDTGGDLGDNSSHSNTSGDADNNSGGFNNNSDDNDTNNSEHNRQNNTSNNEQNNNESIRPSHPVYTVTVVVPADSSITMSSSADTHSAIAAYDGSIINTIYYADAGYYFPSNYYVASINGINVIRNNQRQLTVCGTPTDNTIIILKPATAINTNTGNQAKNETNHRNTNLYVTTEQPVNESTYTSAPISAKEEPVLNPLLEDTSSTITYIEHNNELLNISAKVVWNKKKKAWKLTWNAIPEAAGYEIYTGEGKNSVNLKQYSSISSKRKKMTIYFKKINGKKINTSKLYQFQIRAYDTSNNNQQYIGKSRILYIAGSKNKNHTNIKKIRPARKKISIYRNESVKLTTLIRKEHPAKKLITGASGRKLYYISSDSNVAKVDIYGNVSGINTGTCFIHIITQNGENTKVTVNIK